MAKKFPFESFFDRAAFQADVLRARQLRKYDNGIEGYLRDRGLRYIIEAPPDIKEAQVSEIVRGTLHPQFSVERLFEDFETSPAPEHLRDFFLASLRGVIPRDLSQSPYEGAYELLARYPFLTVEPDLPYTDFLSPGGSTPGSRWSPMVLPALADKAWALRNIRADRAWALFLCAGGDGKGVSVAHLDTGWTEHVDVDQVNFDHLRAKDYIVKGSTARDPLGYIGNPGHGTKTASVIMSRGGVTISFPPGTSPPGEITGVARHSTYVPIRCISSVITIFNGDVARALRYATANDCQVASMSLGGRPLWALRRALRDAVKNDLLVVCAAGNNVRFVVWPAHYQDALAIAASNISDGTWPGTSRGSRIDVSAPGEDVWKADPDPRGLAVSIGSGTSYSTAHMAGVASLWLSYHGRAVLQYTARAMGISLQELFRSLVHATARVPYGWNKSQFGAGIVDAESLLKIPPSSARILSVLPDSTSNAVSLISADDPHMGTLAITELLGIRLSMVEEVIKVFDHELTNALLDNPEILALFRADEPFEALTVGPSRARSALRTKVSKTFRHAVNW
jgi:hypothetical protein